MEVQDQITAYINSHTELKRTEMQELHNLILKVSPACKLWFSDGKNTDGKVVANPTIGYGLFTLKYANGDAKDWFRVGISANTSGISVYILGIDDKSYLKTTFAKTLGKATITGYCIKFKSSNDIDLNILKSAIAFGFENK